jgi:hypothetical protein
LWLKFCPHLSPPSRIPRHSFSLHPANNIWPGITDQEVLRYTDIGKVWTGLTWLRIGTSGALLCDLGVPLNAVKLLARSVAFSLLHGVTQDAALWRAFINTEMNSRAQ